MATYTLPSRSINRLDQFDIMVAGGGPAGIGAAVAAAREGARTLLVEATGCLGGMSTAGLLGSWCPFGDKEKIISRGIAGEIRHACLEHTEAYTPDEPYHMPTIDHEWIKRVYDRMAIEAGVTLMFQTALAGVDVSDDGTVEAALVCNKQGLSAVTAKVFIDCTGDADLAAWAGAEFHKGDGEGDLMPATHCFQIANIDTAWMHNKAALRHARKRMSELLDTGRFKGLDDRWVGFGGAVGPGVHSYNAGHLWSVDGTDPLSLSKAQVAGRELADTIRRLLSEAFPEAFGGSYLVQTAPLVGVRETRRIVGDYVLTLDDYLARRSFPDEIARNCWFVDIHPSRKKVESDFDWEAEKDSYKFAPGESHGIPYRCLTPKGLVNVLVAGRSISCDRPAQSAIRVMPPCIVMGEAAGVAAWQTLTAGTGNVHETDPDHLRARLKALGNYLP